MSNDKFIRRYVFRLYPTKGQEQKLENALRLHCTLYNAALEERITQYRWAKQQEIVTWEKPRGLTYFDQSKALKPIRAAMSEYEALSVDALRATLQRLDRAMKAFFDRVKKGQAPGFPRFQPWQRFTGFGYKAAGLGTPRRKSGGSAYRFEVTGRKTAKLHLDDIGVSIRARGKFPRDGFEFSTCDIKRDRLGWEVSTVVEYETPARVCGRQACGIDIGINTFAAVAYPDGTSKKIKNPRWFKQSKDKTADAGRAVSSKRRGSNNRKRAVMHLVRLKRADKNRRNLWHHKESTRMVREHGLIATEKLTLRNMTASAKGTVEKPGKNVKQKAGLNREMLDVGAGAFLQMLQYKAEEAGADFVEVPTRKVKPSQTCPACGAQKKKTLAERKHNCQSCGYVEDRDVAAARVMLNYALAQMEREAAE